MINNISTIKNFVFEEKETEALLCNILSNELKLFYIYIIEYFCKKTNVAFRSNVENHQTNDLFMKSLQLFETTSEKNLIELSNGEKKIVFTNYKLFKKYQKNKYTLNSYLFKNDLNVFLKDYLGINEKFVYDKILEYPYLIFSEVFSYKINNNQSLISKEINNDFILNIRKELFNLKRLDKDIKKIYSKIKEEFKYKKFSFLIY
ncbi:hypothetical protein N9E32_00670 [Alphaproteobacteria bacterium]|nr:hypothetical protein [Alphaproteobacteria bacterium]